MNDIKKTVKVHFLGGLFDGNYKIYKILTKHFNIIETKNNPDYLIYKNNASYEHLNFDCIKIQWQAELGTPDFDLNDYVIGFDYLQFGDRYLRYPYYMLRHTSDIHSLFMVDEIRESKPTSFIERNFCSYLSSNHQQTSNRDALFYELNRYRKVHSGGSHLNNVGEKISNKRVFLSNYKFNIAAENAIYDGYTTEKIVDAFIAKTIPIYIGNRLICREFNQAAFINANKFSNLDELLKEIIRIDNDPETYLEMLKAPKILPETSIPHQNDLEKFLFNIFDKPVESAKRRPVSQKVNYKIRALKLISIAQKVYLKTPKAIKLIFKFIIRK
jgi:hypothetical protein